MTLAKEVSAALLAGENVGFWSAFPVEERLPEGLVMTQDLPLGICVGPSAKASRFAKTLHLIPKCLILGIGCRRGTDEETIEKFVKQNLRSAGLKMEAAAAVASIDLKKNEPGLVRFCEGHRLPFYTYTAEELKSAPGVFSPSAFVAKTTGVDNVCERAAVLAGAKELLLRKQAAHGVTLAAGLLPVDIRFHTSNLQGEQYEEY
jgi:cobalt-precorrin 5A hydrolase